MQASTFALLAGVAYLLVGILGLVPVMLAPPPGDAPATSFALLYGYLLGLFPVNVLHTALHIAVGFWGLCAWSEKCGAVAFSRALAMIFGALAVLGALPASNTLFGLMPIDGHDVWLHGATALAAAYFGWRAGALRGRRAPGAVRERRHGSAPDRRQRTLPVARERRFGLTDRRDGFGGMSAA